MNKIPACCKDCKDYLKDKCENCKRLADWLDDEKAEVEWVEIYKKISNNWARNCAVSILSELGYQDDRIAKFTGHKDLEMINHYKSVHKKDVKTMMDEVKPEIVKEL